MPRHSHGIVQSQCSSSCQIDWVMRSRALSESRLESVENRHHHELFKKIIKCGTAKHLLSPTGPRAHGQVQNSTIPFCACDKKSQELRTQAAPLGLAAPAAGAGDQEEEEA